jgi:hypothetical protein
LERLDLPVVGGDQCVSSLRLAFGQGTRAEPLKVLKASPAIGSAGKTPAALLMRSLLIDLGPVSRPSADSFSIVATFANR